MTLAGNIKMAQFGCQHLIVCNRQCELDDYIAFGKPPNAASVKPTVTQLLYAGTTLAAQSVQNTMKPRSTHTACRFARRAQPALTHQFAAPTAMRPTRQPTPTVLSGSSIAKSPN